MSPGFRPTAAPRRRTDGILRESDPGRCAELLAPRAARREETHHGHRNHHAPDGRVDRRGDHHQVVEEGRRRRQARRADLRDLDRQGGRRDSVAGRRHAGRDQGRGGRDGRDQHRRRRHRRGRREGRGRSGAQAPAPAPAASAPAPPAPAPGSLRRRRPRPQAGSRRPPAPARAPEPPRRPARAVGSRARPARPVAAEGGQVESIEERIRRRSSPLVRKIAQEHAIEIGEVEGTGIHNRVTKNDILSYLENRKVAAVPSPRPRPLRRRPPSSAAPSRPKPRAPRPAVPGERSRRGRRDVEDPQDHRREHDPLEADLGARHDRLPGRLHEHQPHPRRSTRTRSSRRTASS